MSKTSVSRGLLFVAGLSLAFSTAQAADADGATARDAIAGIADDKLAELERRQQELSRQVAELDAERRQLQQMLIGTGDLEQYRGGADTDATTVGAQQQAEKEAASAQPELPRVSSDVGGVLTRKGTLVLEPALQYTYSSVTRFSIDGFTILPGLLIGIINVDQADRDTYSASLTARYGLTNRIELELRVPYLVRDDTVGRRRVTGGVPEERLTFTDASASDIGDLELGLRYQFTRRPDWPFVTGNLRIKSDTGTDPFELAVKASVLTGGPELFDELPTGTGFWSISPSFTFIYPSDPIVVFGNIGYLYNIEDDKGRNATSCPPPGGPGERPCFGDVRPGDAIRFSFGTGISLNERSSISFSFALDVFEKTFIELQNPQKIPASDNRVGRFLIGYSLRTLGGLPLNLSFGIGATDSAPDTDLTFRIPFTVKK